MKFLQLFFVCVTFCTQYAMANTQEEKIYIDPTNLIFDSTGIWFNSFNDSVQWGTTAIHFDQKGYYITYSEQKWRCPRCSFPNPQGISHCDRCNWPD